jgi:hypothetical protein
MSVCQTGHMPSLSTKVHSQKDRLRGESSPRAESVPNAVPSPSGLLADQIEAIAVIRNRPAWHLGTDPKLLDLYGGTDLCVPRVPAYPCKDPPEPHGRWAVEFAHQAPRIKPRVATWLEAPLAAHERGLGTDDEGQLRNLRMAAVRDIVGVSEEQLCEAFQYQDNESARRRVRRGRGLLRELGAWPWCTFKDDTGRPPQGWWQNGHPFARGVFEWWRTESLLALGQFSESDRPLTVAGGGLGG